jgi:hypothetical protein
VEWLSQLQKPLFDSIHGFLMSHQPDLVVVDREALGALDAIDANRLVKNQGEYAVAILNPRGFLHDLGSPPLYMPAPYSSMRLQGATVWERIVNIKAWVLHRLALLRALNTVNEVRAESGLLPLHSSDTR